MQNKTQDFMIKGNIFNIIRCSLNDGYGIRTVVYFKGCNLRCKWCHNPEGLTAKRQIMFYAHKCINCGRCINICPKLCHKMDNGMHIINFKNCILCGKCVEICPDNALQLMGKEYLAEELLAEINKDKAYYFETGGVTFSGGECLLQIDFLQEILYLCKEKGINTALETAISVPWENIERILPLVDMFIVDLKIMDSEIHKKYIGKDNFLILENIKKLSYEHNNIRIRIPLIPQINDNDDNLTKSCEFINSIGSGIKEIELLKYNNLAESKYKAIDIPYTVFSKESQNDIDYKKKKDICRTILNNNIKVI